MAKAMEATALLEMRRDGIAIWLKENAPECGREQKHLDKGTEARTYWHYGYLVAIKDALALIGGTNVPKH